MRALGIDYGGRRIGLALSDATGLLARPWKTIPAPGSPRAAAREIRRIVAQLRSEEDGLVAVVIGLPRRLTGEETHLTASVTALADALRATVGVPVVLQDERLTSHEADSLLARREKDWRRRKAQLDAVAASIILQDYLDHARLRTDGGTEGEGPAS